MMRCRELLKRLEELAPAEYACDWDNPGFLAGRADKEIHKVFVALDATDEAVDQAIEEKADLLLTHHPLIFKALKKVNDEDFVSRRILRMIQADLCYVAMHTNFDCAPEGMAQASMSTACSRRASMVGFMSWQSTWKKRDLGRTMMRSNWAWARMRVKASKPRPKHSASEVAARITA